MSGNSKNDQPDASRIRSDEQWKHFFEDILRNSPMLKEARADPIKGVLIPWFDALEIVSAQQLSENTGRLIVRFPVQHEYLNYRGTLQGGLQTAMYDVISSWVFFYHKAWAGTGISRTLTTAYLRPAPEGEMVLMDCELVHAGKRLGLSKGVLKREKDGAIISTCEHHKYNTNANMPSKI